MFRRRPLARAAMVGGAAYYAGKHVQQGREAESDQDARLAALEDQQAYAPPPPAAPAPAAPKVDVVAELERLAGLKDKGILTEVEFEVQKQKLLQQM